MKRSQAANFGENRRQERARELKAAMNKAKILSVNADAARNTFRISLQWQGNYDIPDFDLQQFGKVLSIQDETPNTGWAIIERSFHVAIGYSLPQSMSGTILSVREKLFRCDQILKRSSISESSF
jgi:hypothetical protein